MKLVLMHQKMKKAMEGRKGERNAALATALWTGHGRQREQAQQRGLEGLAETAIGFAIPSQMPVV